MLTRQSKIQNEHEEASKEPNDSIFQKTLALSDFYLGSDDWAYPMGLIQMLGKVDADLMLTIIANALRVGDHLLARMR